MTKRSLAGATLIVVAATALSVSSSARAQQAVRFEYLRVAPYTRLDNSSPPALPAQRFAGYRACAAETSGWTCRDVGQPPDSKDDVALPATLAALGNDGWELVSAAELVEHREPTGRWTYLFKRPRP